MKEGAGWYQITGLPKGAYIINYLLTWHLVTAGINIVGKIGFQIFKWFVHGIVGHSCAKTFWFYGLPFSKQNSGVRQYWGHNIPVKTTLLPLARNLCWEYFIINSFYQGRELSGQTPIARKESLGDSQNQKNWTTHIVLDLI